DRLVPAGNVEAVAGLQAARTLRDEWPGNEIADRDCRDDADPNRNRTHLALPSDAPNQDGSVLPVEIVPGLGRRSIEILTPGSCFDLEPHRPVEGDRGAI